jgi:hypothetical protein
MPDWMGNLVDKDGTFAMDIGVDPNDRDFRS